MVILVLLDDGETPAGVSRPVVPVETGARRIQPSAS